MPALSVTVIGLLIAVLFSSIKKTPMSTTLLTGFLAAWAGFIAGAIIGATLDAIMQTGVFVAYIGHAAAAVATYVVLNKRFAKHKA